jgi:hypothetical protein
MNNYDYILIYPSGQNRDPFFYTSPVLNNYFFDEYTKLEFAQNTVRIYRFYPEGAGSAKITANILLNGGFEETNLDGMPASWSLIGSPYFDFSGKYSLKGVGSIKVDGPSKSLLFQDVSVQEGTLYTLGNWAMSDQPNQVSQVFIEWLDENKHPIRRSVERENLSQEWRYYSFPATAPKNSVIARIYVSLSSDGGAWFDEFCFVQGDRCN